MKLYLYNNSSDKKRLVKQLDLVDVLDAGVVHASGASCVRVECALEHCAEDGGRDFAPVEVEAGILEKCLLQFFGELWYLYLFLEESAVGVGKGFQVVFQITASLVEGSVQNIEKAQESIAHLIGFVAGKIGMKLVVLEGSGIFGIESLVWLKGQFWAEPVPIFIDIREICDN